MRIKFLETTPSASPDAPFQAGQIIEVETLSPDIILALAGPAPRAVVLAAPLTETDALEAAVVDDTTERAVLPRAKARKP